MDKNNQDDIQTVSSSILNFLFSPHGGYLKGVEDFFIQREGVKLFLIKRNNKEKKIPLTSEHRYMGLKKYVFILKSSWIPLLAIFLMLVFASRYAFHVGTESTIIIFTYGVGMFYLIPWDFYSTFKKYKSGKDEILKKDKKRIKILAIVAIVAAVFAFMNIVGMLAMFAIVIYTMAYFTYIDLVKSKMLIALSENVRFWTYGDGNTNKRYGLIAPKI